MDNFTQSYFNAMVNAPSITRVIIPYKFDPSLFQIPGKNEFYKQPFVIIPDVMDGEFFLQITHSDLIPNILPGRYYISNYGRVFDAYNMRYMNGYVNKGFVQVKLTYMKDYNKLDTKTIYIHQLVNYFFNYDNRGIREKYIHIHKDNNKANNRADNLEWISKEEYKKRQINANDEDNQIYNNRSLSHCKISIETAKKVCELIAKGYNPPAIHLITGVSEDSINEIKFKRSLEWLSKDYF